MRSIAEVDWNPGKEGYTITGGKVKPAHQSRTRDLLKALGKEAL
jgi:hypothetical protein